MVLRLNQFIAHTGLCARRKADTLIVAGKIEVNGKCTTALHTTVNPKVDEVFYQGRRLMVAPKVYYLLNKPTNTITTRYDPQGRKKVCDYVPRIPKVYPVGRLDRNTTGLLLLTNDGQFAKHLAHPSSETSKCYHVTLHRAVHSQDLKRIQQGVVLADGPMTVDDVAFLKSDQRHISVTLHSGRNRIIRRLFAHLGYRVTQLDRVKYGQLTQADLPRGQWRRLTRKEIIELFAWVRAG